MRTEEVELIQPMKNGELVLRLRGTHYRGAMRPYIVRSVSRSDAREKQVSEQHTVIKDRGDLLDWISRDELSSIYPEFFDRVRTQCEELIR
jgi:hypothetical protein